MSKSTAEPVTIPVEGAQTVSGLWQAASGAKACFVLAHSAGAGMRHPFLETFASHLATVQIATLRYQFLYMDRGSRRPDPPKLCHAVVRAAVAEAARRTSAPLIAGGRSFGGRMTSQAQAESPLAGVRGLVFLAFPLHPARRPSIDRAQHLFDVRVPMLFLQGTRDELADLQLLQPLLTKLGNGTSSKLIEHADHSFHVPVRTGRNDAAVVAELVATLSNWVDSQLR